MYQYPSQQAGSYRLNKAALCVFLWGLGFSGISFAEEGGWYLDTRFDRSLASEDSSDFSMPATGADNRTGWSLSAGYRFNPTWSLEAAYQENNAVDLDAGFDNDFNSPNLSLAPHRALQLTGTANLPFNSGFSLFGRVGMLDWDARPNGPGADFASLYSGYRGTDFRFGAGSHYQFGDNLSLRADWDHYFLDQNEVDLFSARLNYRFK